MNNKFENTGLNLFSPIYIKRLVSAFIYSLFKLSYYLTRLQKYFFVSLQKKIHWSTHPTPGPEGLALSRKLPRGMVTLGQTEPCISQRFFCHASRYFASRCGGLCFQIDNFFFACLFVFFE